MIALIIYIFGAVLCYYALTIKDAKIKRSFTKLELSYLVPLWFVVTGFAVWPDLVKLWRWLKARRK